MSADPARLACDPGRKGGRAAFAYVFTLPTAVLQQAFKTLFVFNLLGNYSTVIYTNIDLDLEYKQNKTTANQAKRGINILEDSIQNRSVNCSAHSGR